ncbi:hypothetical protein OXR01_00595 [Staphylococcus gallinarum]|uniref:Uncharacterized protein n=1 Tax=Staphylococcus gallinarum TaxID=1293 RepID=A0ABQ0Y0E3_STAGA|nr:hypothetical protein [Staphylococcus gallinarum]MBU7218202.1 hypothetical protein [Staphylococcus gallinarum]MCD8785918.1 hypothetical protein [Staphylococcus gallinarum]MCD8793221.1 hypothetical protein [Staphylococcus gallinarum]MCD8820890.1 hypothetical protein [Staphylococcus gallinarum]MCD8825565.1 hypothetical protein [Staphylococcus gallinarum]
MKEKLKQQLNKYVENGQLEKGLNKVNDQVKKKKGKDYSKYVDKLMKFLNKDKNNNK